VSKIADQVEQITPLAVGQRQEYSEDGVDLSLIRWMLDMTPTERLMSGEQFANDILELRGGLH
jgi:hypothetical protein